MVYTHRPRDRKAAVPQESPCDSSDSRVGTTHRGPGADRGGIVARWGGPGSSSPSPHGGDTAPYVSRVTQLCASVGARLISIGNGWEGGDADVHEALRDVGLTVASTSITLLHLNQSMLEAEGLPLPPHPDLLQSYARALDGPTRYHQLPPGGMVSLLYHLSSRLESLDRELSRLAAPGHIETGIRAARAVVVEAPAALRAGVPPATVLRSSLRRLTTAALGPLNPARDWAEEAAIRLVLAQPVLEGLASRLRRCNDELNVILRLWTIGQSLLPPAILVPPVPHKAGMAPGAIPLTGLVRTGELGDVPSPLAKGPVDTFLGAAEERESLPLARRILQALHAPRSAIMWNQRSLRNALLCRLLDTYYAAFGYAVGRTLRLPRALGDVLLLPLVLCALIVYAFAPRRAVERVTAMMARPDIALISRMWRLADSPWLSRLQGFLRPRAHGTLPTSRKITIAGVPCIVLSNTRLTDAELGADGPATITEGHPAATTTGGHARSGDKQPMPRLRTAESDVLLSEAAQAAEEAEAREREEGRAEPSPHASAVITPHGSCLPPTMIYVHGGGFISSSTGHDIRTFSAWLASTPEERPWLIIYPVYSLSPEARYPTPTRECARVYAAIAARSPTRLIVAGESAGGHIAASLVVSLISEGGKRLPDGAAFLYPSLSISQSPTPSRLLHMADPILSYAVLIELARSHLPPGSTMCDEMPGDISPIHASDAVLRHFPPCYISAGGLDPLLDDSLAFHTRLSQLGRQSLLDIFRDLPHGYAGFTILAGSAQGVEGFRRAVQGFLKVRASDPPTPASLSGDGSGVGTRTSRQTL